MILGTAAVHGAGAGEGKPVDRRADVWAFGVILHEMLTGERTFAADTVGESIAAVLTREPDLSRAPMRARRLLHACLQKDSRKRLRDIGDAQILLDSAEDTPAPTSRRGLVPWVVATLVIGAVAAGAAMWRVRSAPPQIPFVFHEPAPEGTRLMEHPGCHPTANPWRSSRLLRTDSGRFGCERWTTRRRGRSRGRRGRARCSGRPTTPSSRSPLLASCSGFLEAEGRGSVWRRQIRPRRGRRLVCGRRRAS